MSDEQFILIAALLCLIASVIILNERGDAMNLLNDAIILATVAHGKQVDKAGQPYILHPLRVMLGVPEHLRVAAVLHDVIEDTNLTIEQILVMYGPENAQLVDAVSRREGETYNDFIKRCAQHSPDARIIKRADIQDNIGRLTPELAGMGKRYAKALAILDEYDSVTENRAAQLRELEKGGA
jgi:(p)ppGpp synthase/HD superfamily hydrolase